jgi:hypothetical protein
MMTRPHLPPVPRARALRLGPILLGGVLLGLPLAAAASPVTDAAAEVDARVQAGDSAGAVAKAREILDLVWQASPGLGFTDALLVMEPARGFGVYNPRPDNIFRKGEAIEIYAEPYGFGYGNPGEGLYSIGFHVDLQVLAPDGQVLAEVPDVTRLEMTSRYRNKEFQANLTYHLDGVPAGSYRLVTTLRDANSPKLGTFEIEIGIAE